LIGLNQAEAIDKEAATLDLPHPQIESDERKSAVRPIRWKTLLLAGKVLGGTLTR
jgi:hypothetical protein